MDSSDTSAQLEPTGHAPTSTNSTPPTKKNRILAAFLSAVMPGTGHLLRRDHLRAAIFLPGEPYAEFDAENYIPENRTYSERVVAPGKLFVMGDNRDFSFDSRLAKHGDVDVSAVTGRALYSFSLDGENSSLTAPK
jgi:hypothetical protein